MAEPFHLTSTRLFRARIIITLLNVLEQNNAKIEPLPYNGGGGASAVVIERI
jgi:acetyl-CoA C-acetyltransferase